MPMGASIHPMWFRAVSPEWVPFFHLQWKIHPLTKPSPKFESCFFLVSLIFLPLRLMQSGSQGADLMKYPSSGMQKSSVSPQSAVNQQHYLAFRKTWRTLFISAYYTVSISYLSKWGGILTMVSTPPKVSVKGKFTKLQLDI